MYNNLEAMWRQTQHQQRKKEVDAFSQEFDMRMKIVGGPNTGGGTNNAGAQTRHNGGSKNHNSSTMPRPASIQPTMNHSQQYQQVCKIL